MDAREEIARLWAAMLGVGEEWVVVFCGVQRVRRASEVGSPIVAVPLVEAEVAGPGPLVNRATAWGTSERAAQAALLDLVRLRVRMPEARIWCDEAANAIRVSFREDGETTFSGRFGDGPWNAVVNMLHATGILPRPGDPSLGWKPPQRRREAP